MRACASTLLNELSRKRPCELISSTWNPLPDALLLVSKARVLLGGQRAAEAIACLHLVVGRTASLDQVQARLDAWLLLGEAHEAQGEGQQAMLAFGEALRSAPHGDAKGHLCAHRQLARGIFAPALC